MRKMAVDLEAARVYQAKDGSVVFDDPNSDIVVTVWTEKPTSRRPVLAQITVTARHEFIGVSASHLRRLAATVDQLVDLAGTQQHPNHVYYQMLAKRRPHGQRSWDDDHYARVLDVYQWAKDTGRRGGGQRAVADLWGVSIKPTAQRWLAEARRRKEDNATDTER